MKRILCSILICSQILSCAAGVSVPPDRTSGDTTKMDFDADGDGNVVVSTREPTESESESSGAVDYPPPDNGGSHSGGGGGGGSGSVPLNLPGIYKGIGDLAAKLGGLIQDGIGEITGENRRQKREAERKAKELEGLAQEAEKIQVEIGKRAKELEGSTSQVGSSDFYGEKDTQDAVNGRGRDHNDDIDKTRDSFPELGNDSNPDEGTGPGGRDPYPTPEKEKVRVTKDFLKASRKAVQESYQGDDRKEREKILDTADSAANSAEDSYGSGDTAGGDAKLEIAKGLADLALSATPGVGEAWDIFCAVNGSNPITGETYSDEERAGMAAAAIGSLASGGVVGVVKDIGKAAGILKDIAKRKARDEAKKAGQGPVDPKKDKEIDQQFENGSKGARNAGNKQSAADFEKSISKMSPGERVATVRAKTDQVAKESGWNKNNNVSRKNNRQVYTDGDGNHWSVDTQHGRFEKFDSRGRHQGEYNIDKELIPDSVVKDRWLIL